MVKFGYTAKKTCKRFGKYTLKFYLRAYFLLVCLYFFIIIFLFCRNANTINCYVNNVNLEVLTKGFNYYSLLLLLQFYY